MLTTLLANLLLLAPPPTPAQTAADPLEALEQRQQALFSATAPSVVLVRTHDGIGSGFFVSATGLVLTNRHVVGEATDVDIVLHDGRKAKGKVVQVAEDDIDLALIQVDARKVPALSLADGRSVRVGAWAAAVGHGEGAIWTFNTGMISNIYPPNEMPVLQTQIPLNPGNSGGPVIDRQGRVVGVVTAGMAGAQSLNFAIRIEVALQKLPRLRAHCDCLTVHAPDGVPVFVDGTLAGHGPMVVAVVEPGAHEAFVVFGGKRRVASASMPTVRTIDLRQ